MCPNARPFSAQILGTQCSTKFADTELNTQMSGGSGARTLPVYAVAVMPRSARRVVVICRVFGLRSSSSIVGFRGRVCGAAEVPAGSGADVEVPTTEVEVVDRQQRPAVWGGAGLLRLGDLICRHA